MGGWGDPISCSFRLALRTYPDGPTITIDNASRSKQLEWIGFKRHRTFYMSLVIALSSLSYFKRISITQFYNMQEIRIGPITSLRRLGISEYSLWYCLQTYILASRLIRLSDFDKKPLLANSPSFHLSAVSCCLWELPEVINYLRLFESQPSTFQVPPTLL